MADVGRRRPQELTRRPGEPGFLPNDQAETHPARRHPDDLRSAGQHHDAVTGPVAAVADEVSKIGRTGRVSRLTGHPSRGQGENRMVLHPLGAGIRAPVGHEHYTRLDQLQPAE